MDVSKEFMAAQRRVRAAVERGVGEAERRIRELTPMEWSEVASGMREHPEVMRERLTRERYAVSGELLGRLARSLNDAVASFVEAFRRGFEEGGSR